MKTTVERIEPYLLQARGSIKSVVGHFMLVKTGEREALREAYHEIHELRDASERAGFTKVAHLCANMEDVIEAAFQEGPERLGESLEVLCDMCAHIVLYVDTVLLYADTVAMVIEFPWIRDQLALRLKHVAPDAFLDELPLQAGLGAREARAIAVLKGGESGPEATLARLQDLYDNGAPDSNWIVDVTGIDEAPLWLLGALVSYHVALKKQGRKLCLTGLRPGVTPCDPLRRLSDRLSQTDSRWAV